jgi:hypothetical protein
VEQWKTILELDIILHKEEYKKLGIKKNIIPKLKKFYKKLFNKSFPDKFNGLDIIKTLEMTKMRDYNI